MSIFPEVIGKVVCKKGDNYLPLVVFYLNENENVVSEIATRLEDQIIKRYSTNRYEKHPQYAKKISSEGLVYICQGEAQHRAMVKSDLDKFFCGENYYKYRIR